MSKFKDDGGKETPAISTASLPDIIFMLLFFFMVVTQLRETEIKVDVITPKATELTKLLQKTLVNTIYVGKPKEKYQNLYGTAPKLQLSDQVADPRDIPLFLENFRQNVPEKQRGGIISSLRIDGNVTMGILTDIKTELRKSNQLKINYSAKPRTEQ
ncbi:MAG: biopolymer transporter ExbD [Bacteroidota bacterium]